MKQVSLNEVRRHIFAANCRHPRNRNKVVGNDLEGKQNHKIQNGGTEHIDSLSLMLLSGARTNQWHYVAAHTQQD